MKNIFNYTFFQIHQSLKRAKNLTPVASSIMLFASMQLLNIITFTILFKVNLEPFLVFKALTFGFYIIILIALNGIYFLFKGRYKKIYEKFITESKEQRKKGWNYVRLYMILSIVAIIVVLVYK